MLISSVIFMLSPGAIAASDFVEYMPPDTTTYSLVPFRFDGNLTPLFAR